MNDVRKRVSEILASIAIIMLAVYLTDVLLYVTTGHSGFLSISSKDRGMVFGGGSLTLFIIAFILSINFPSKIVSTLLIIGGAITGSAVLASTFVTPVLANSFDGIKLITPSLPQFIGIIIIGYGIIGLGVFKVIKKIY